MKRRNRAALFAGVTYRLTRCQGCRVSLSQSKTEAHTLYASHTVWESRAAFETWTKSVAFRAAHSRAGDNKPLYLDDPQFEVRQSVGRGKGKVV